MKRNLFLLAAILCYGYLGATINFYKKPYSMCPTTSSVKVLWQTTDHNAAGTVYYGTTPDNLSLSTSTTDGKDIAEEGFVHVATLTGLQPFTTYYYQVGNNSERDQTVYQTKTAPSTNTAFRIFTISDIHVNARNNWQNMQPHIASLMPDLMMFNGDFVNEGNHRDWNEAFFTPGEPTLTAFPMMTSVGNHESGDPTTYRWATHFDYFWQFNHGSSEDDIKDPRGEAYFAFNYGNVRMIVLQLNGDKSSPDFKADSKQYAWLENELKTATQPWIFIWNHVGVHTSGYHGRWSETRNLYGPLFETYAAKGKHIIDFCGDDHSFEHLYKDGVHYVRPGCGRDANYYQQRQLSDAQYSLEYDKKSCYSTLDMSADGQTVKMTTYNELGQPFYHFTFSRTAPLTRQIQITQAVANTSVGDSLVVCYSAFDPNYITANTTNAQVDLCYSTSPTEPGTAFATNLSARFYDSYKAVWNTRSIYPKGTYYVYAVLKDPDGSTESERIPVTLVEDQTPPTPPVDLDGQWDAEGINLSWLNPTHELRQFTPIASFDESTDGFLPTGDNGSATLNRVYHKKDEHPSPAMRISYTVTEAWGEAGAYLPFKPAANFRHRPILEFDYAGDASSNSLRVIIHTASGKAEDDWWYNEAYTLVDAEWHRGSIDMSAFQPLDWHPNVKNQPDLNNITGIVFVVPSATKCTDNKIYLDSIQAVQYLHPVADYKGTKIVRNNDHYATSVTDGTTIYDGTAEQLLDKDVIPGQDYYYVAFAYDDRNNYTAYAATAAWSTKGKPVDDLPTLFGQPQSVRKILLNGQIFILRNNKMYPIL